MDIDALDRAARLAGVVERAVGDAGRGGLDVDVFAHVHGVLAAELELGLHHLPAGSGRDAGAGGIGAGEEDAVQRLTQQRGAGRTTPDHWHEHVGRDPRFVQHFGDVEAGERRVFGRFVEHRIAGDQRRDEHVAAHEIGVIPRRDVADDAERLVGDPLLEILPGIGVDLLRAQRLLRLGEEKIDPRQEAVEFVARLPDRLADLLGQRAREGFMHRHDPFAKGGHRG